MTTTIDGQLTLFAPEAAAAEPRPAAAAAEKVIEEACEVLAEVLTVNCSLIDAGFRENEFGEFIAKGCTVVLYHCCGGWEIDIHQPGGASIGCDTPRLQIAPSPKAKGPKP